MRVPAVTPSSWRMPHHRRWLQVPERFQAADDLALLLLGVRTLLGARQQLQHLERVERLLDARAGRGLGYGDLDFRALGRLVRRAGGFAPGPRVDLDHAAELAAHALARRTRPHRPRDPHAPPGACEHPRDEVPGPLPL